MHRRLHLRPSKQLLGSLVALGVLAILAGAVLLAVSHRRAAYALGSGSMSLEPASQTQFPGTRFDVNVTGANDIPLGAFEIVLSFDSSLITYVSGGATPSYLASTGRRVTCFNPPIITTSGTSSTLRTGCTMLGGAPPSGPVGGGILGTFTFQASSDSTGTAAITFDASSFGSGMSNDNAAADSFDLVTYSNATVDIVANNGSPLPSATVTNTPTITPVPTNTVAPSATPTGIAPPGACGPQDAAALCFSPAAVAGFVGVPLNVDLRVEDVANVISFDVTLAFDAQLLQPLDALPGPFLSSTGRTVLCLPLVQTATTVSFRCVTLGTTDPTQGGLPGAGGSGTLATFAFQPLQVSAGTTISINAGLLLRPDLRPGHLGDTLALPVGISDVATISISPQPTATPCPGACPTHTPTPTLTPLPSATATRTATSTRTPTPTATACPGTCPTVTPTTTATATATAPSGLAAVSIDPASQTVSAGQNVQFDVSVANVANLGAFSVVIQFDPLILRKQQADVGAFLASSGRTNVVCFSPGSGDPSPTPTSAPGATATSTAVSADPSPGTLAINCVTLAPPTMTGATGDGILLHVTLNAIAPASSSAITLPTVTLITPFGEAIPAAVTAGGTVTVLTAATPTPCSGPCPTATPTSTPTATPSPGGLAHISLSPAQQIVPPGTTVQVAIDIGVAQNVGAFQFSLKFPASILQFVDAEDGGFIGSGGRDPLCPLPFIVNGEIHFGCATNGAGTGASGAGTLAYLTFRTIAAGFGDLQVKSIDLVDPQGNDIPRSLTDLPDEIVVIGSARTPTASPTSTRTPTITPTPAIQPACAVQAGGNGLTCFVVDTDPSQPGEQNEQNVPASGAFSVDVYARGVPSSNSGLSSFNFTITYDLSWLDAGTPTSPLVASNGFVCSLPPPTGHLPESDFSADGDPATGDAFLSCFNPSAASGPSGIVKIATIPFTIIAKGRSPLIFFRSRIAGGADIVLASCNPIDVEPGAGCLNGSVFNTAPTPPAGATVTPSPTHTPTPTSTPSPTTTPTPALAPVLGGTDIDAPVVGVERSFLTALPIVRLVFRAVALAQLAAH